MYPLATLDFVNKMTRYAIQVLLLRTVTKNVVKVYNELASFVVVCDTLD